MGFFDDLKKLTNPYDGDDDEGFVDEAESAAPARERSRANPFDRYGDGGAAQPRAAAQPRPVRTGGRVMNVSGGNSQLVIVQPKDFNSSAKLIADHLKERRGVLMNMENTPEAAVQRLVDFTSGVTYAIGGEIQRIGPKVVILTPSNMDLVGDQLDEVQNNANNGVYF